MHAYPDPLLQEHTIKKELKRGEECLMIIVHEVMKKRIPNACKNRMFYYTFIPRKVTECLRLYLSERVERYGPIFDGQPIFITKNRRIPLRERLGTPISPRELQLIVKKLAKRAGIENWEHVYPHCLRKTYEGFLRNQPDDVKLDDKESEFLFGHILPGSQDTYFDKTKIDHIRGKYARMISEPTTSVDKDEDVIDEDKLQTFLQQGWHYEATLRSGKVVVSRRAIKKQPTEVKAPSEPQFSTNSDTTGKSLHEYPNPLRQDQSLVPDCAATIKNNESRNFETRPESNSKFLAVEEKKNIPRAQCGLMQWIPQDKAKKSF